MLPSSAKYAIARAFASDLPDNFTPFSVTHRQETPVHVPSPEHREPGKRTAWTPEDIEKLKTMAESGASALELSVSLSRSEAAIATAIHRFGVRVLRSKTRRSQ